MAKLKKGIITIQFHWIFVLIVGAIILSFFIVIVQKQKVTAEEGLSADIQIQLRAIFSSSQVSTGTASIVDIPSRDIEFSCEGFKIGSQSPAAFPYAFGPDLLSSDRNTLSIYALDWSVPFRVTNFLYVTSPEVRYIFMRPEVSLYRQLESILPPETIQKGGQERLFMNREVISYQTENPPSQISDTNNYKIRMIYLGSPLASPNNIENTEDKHISAVRIEGSLESGQVTFYTHQGTTAWKLGRTFHYVGEAALLAAIFSENEDIYECGMKNAFARLNAVTTIYESRLSGLVCPGIDITQAEPLLSPLKSATLNEATQVKNLGDQLDELNDDLLANSCPPVY